MTFDKISKYFNRKLSDDNEYTFAGSNWLVSVSKDTDDITKMYQLCNIPGNVLKRILTFARTPVKYRFSSGKLSWKNVLGVAKHYGYSYNDDDIFVNGDLGIIIGFNPDTQDINITMTNTGKVAPQLIGTLQRYLKDLDSFDTGSVFSDNNSISHLSDESTVKPDTDWKKLESGKNYRETDTEKNKPKHKSTKKQSKSKQKKSSDSLDDMGKMLTGMMESSGMKNNGDLGSLVNDFLKDVNNPKKTDIFGPKEKKAIKSAISTVHDMLHNGGIDSDLDGILGIYEKFSKELKSIGWKMDSHFDKNGDALKIYEPKSDNNIIIRKNGLDVNVHHLSPSQEKNLNKAIKFGSDLLKQVKK